MVSLLLLLYQSKIDFSFQGRSLLCHVLHPSAFETKREKKRGKEEKRLISSPGKRKMKRTTGIMAVLGPGMDPLLVSACE